MTDEVRPSRTAGSAFPLLIGLGIQAVTTYLVLVIAGRALGAASFGALSTLYVLVTAISTGLFLPLEQEVARRRGDERGRGIWDESLLPRAMRFGLGLAAAACAVVVIAFPVSLRLLSHDRNLVAALCVGLVGYACCYVSRGELAGRRQLIRYGVQLSVEGGSRIVGVLVLVAADVHSATWFGWLFAAAPWLAFLISTRRWPRPAAQRLPDHGPSLGRPVALLVISSLASQLLINAGPLVVALLARSSDRAEVGVFFAALVVVRIPVFLFTAVQPSFLPKLAEHAAADRRDRFVHLIARVLAVCIAFVVISTAAAAAIGPWTMRLLFGFEQQLSRWTYFQMTLAVGLFLVSAVLAQSLLGRGVHAATTFGWLAGLAGLAAGTTLGSDAVARASAGFLTGALVSTAVLAVLWAREMRSWTRPAAQSGAWSG